MSAASFIQSFTRKEGNPHLRRICLLTCYFYLLKCRFPYSICIQRCSLTNVATWFRGSSLLLRRPCTRGSDKGTNFLRERFLLQKSPGPFHGTEPEVLGRRRRRTCRMAPPPLNLDDNLRGPGITSGFPIPAIHLSLWRSDLIYL